MKSKISQVFAVLILAAGFGFWLFAERWRLLRPSTLAGLRAGGARNTLNLNALHMYLYGRWTNQYLLTSTPVPQSRSRNALPRASTSMSRSSITARTMPCPNR